MLDDAMRAYYAAYNSEAPDRLGDLLHDDVILASAAGTQQGKEAYLSTYRYMIANFIDRMEPQDIAVDASEATVRIVDRLTARADIPDFLGQSLAAGETITLNLIGRYTFADGRISRIEISSAS